MFKLFKNSKVKNSKALQKLILSSVVILIMPTALLGLILKSEMVSILEKNIIESVKSTNLNVANQINSTLSDLLKVSTTISLNSSFLPHNVSDDLVSKKMLKANPCTSPYSFRSDKILECNLYTIHWHICKQNYYCKCRQ